VAEDAEHLPQVIRAEPVVLRRHQVDDAREMASAIAETIEELRPWMPWASPEATDPEFQRTRIEGDLPNWGRRGHEATYVIQSANSGQLLGVCGIQNRGAPVAREIGYWLRRTAEGKGYATAAASALTTTALTLPGVQRVEIRCDVANVRSAGVARRCGYRLLHTEPHDPQAPGHTGTFMVWTRDQIG
jgi:ribosomal-protein-serine acetyltransferase